MGVATEKSKSSAARSTREAMPCDGFNSSDDEVDTVDNSPFKIDWLNLSEYDFNQQLGISGLPGCRFNDTWRSVDSDIDSIVSQGVEEIFVLCTRGELHKYRVPRLLQEYGRAGLATHHYPFPAGLVPSLGNCFKMLEEIRVHLQSGRGVLVHCVEGIGRSALIAACLLLLVDGDLEWKDALARIRELKGSGAIQTVKQYNFVSDFCKMQEQYEASNPDADRRSISR